MGSFSSNKAGEQRIFSLYFASCFSEVQILFCRVIHKVLTSQRVKSYLSFSLYQQTDEKLLNPDISYTMASKHPQIFENLSWHLKINPESKDLAA